MKILLTGYSGFLGAHLVEALKVDHSLRLLGRKKVSFDGIEHLFCDFSPQFSYSEAVRDCDIVIHSAARVHVMNEQESDPLSAFREINTYATLQLAKEAAQAGVKRFIFISTIKVNGESTTGRRPFSALDEPNPEDPYGISKAEAEEQLIQISEQTGMEVVVIRPPLIYGPGVKANFAALMKLVSKGFPLPFRCINNNKRSLLSVFNLVDLIRECMTNPHAANQTFLASDDQDLSTFEMVALMAEVQNKANMSVPIPLWCYKIAGNLFRKQDVVDRLIGSLQVDINHTKNTLNWKPPVSVKKGFQLTVTKNEMEN